MEEHIKQAFLSMESSFPIVKDYLQTQIKDQLVITENEVEFRKLQAYHSYLEQLDLTIKNLKE